MDDDFNTSEALAALFDLAREINRLRVEDEAAAARLGITLKYLGELLGLLQSDPETFFRGSPVIGTMNVTEASDSASFHATHIIPDAGIEALIAERTAARKAKNWAEGDRIRALLQEAGILLEDTPKGTIWRRG